ncbi:MAG: hypothetical protein J7549_11235 [Variovorax sp.]|nr:hypothetical protein [Variovorax sp.]
MNKPLYNETFQNREAPPTAYESLLGDAIERAYAQGLHELDALVNYLNQSGPLAPTGEPWTAGGYVREMTRLGA